MATNLDIRLKRADKIYREGENIIGLISLNAPTDLKHDGISLTAEGFVNLQLSSKNVGIIDAFYSSVKPVQVLGVNCEVSGAGRLPSGLTEIPFEIPLKPKANRVLYETYHGVYINISYAIRCDIKRSFLSKDLQKSQQFFVQYWPGRNPGIPPQIKTNKSITFKLSPSSLTSGGSGAPDFLLTGQIDSTCCSVNKPLTGHVILEKCTAPLRSIEIQLVRVETYGCAEGYAKEMTEIQNIQIADGDVPTNIDLPLYMVFPRVFACPTLITTNFKIEFEINLVMVFYDDHLITNNFPLILVRE